MSLEVQIYQLIAADTIKRAIEEKGWTLDVVVKRCRERMPGLPLDSSKVSRICNANYEPKNLEMWTLCKVLGLKQGDLIPDDISAQFLQNAIERIQRQTKT